MPTPMPALLTITDDLLLELLYKSFALLRHPLPRPVFRLVQWPLLYSLLVPAIIGAMGSVMRMKYVDVSKASLFRQRASRMTLSCVPAG
jgi:hypothetical protein